MTQTDRRRKAGKHDNMTRSPAAMLMKIDALVHAALSAGDTD